MAEWDQDAQDATPALHGIRLLIGERWTLPLKAPKVSTPWRKSGLVTPAEAVPQRSPADSAYPSTVFGHERRRYYAPTEVPAGPI